MRYALITAAAGLVARGAFEELPGSRRLRERLRIPEQRATSEHRQALTHELSARTYGVAAQRRLVGLVEDAVIADFAAAQAAGDRARQQKHLVEIAILLAHRGLGDAAGDWISRAEQVAVSRSDAEGRTAILGDKGLIKWLAGRYEEAATDLTQARDAFTNSHDLAGASRAESHLGIVALSRSRFDEARAFLESALGRIPADREKDRAVVHLALGEVEIASGRHEDASSHLDVVRRLASASDDKELLAAVAFDEAHFRQKQGNFREAAKLFMSAADGYWESARWHLHAQALGNAGIAAAWMGDLKTAEKMVRRASGCFVDLGDERALAQAELNLGVILLEQQELTEAKKHIEYALTRFRRFGDPVAIAKASEAHACVLGRLELDTAITTESGGPRAKPPGVRKSARKKR